MNETPITTADQVGLKWLRILVVVLTITMIAGFLTIVVLFVVRFKELSKPVELTLPDNISLPSGEMPKSVTVGRDWYAIVSTSNEILVYDRDTGEIFKRITIEHEEALNSVAQ